MVIKKQLKEYIYGVISETIPITKFEQWLYTQTELVDDLDNELNLALFSFDYKQRGAVYEFTKIVTPHIDGKDVELWRSKAYLCVLAVGNEGEIHAKVLDYFNDWEYDGCVALHYLGSDVKNYWSYYNDPIEVIKSDLRKEALELFVRVCFEESKVPGFDIYQFPYFKIGESEEISEIISSSIEGMSKKKWWQLWR